MKVSPELEAKCLELAGLKPTVKPKRKAREVRLASTAAWEIVLLPSCRVVTEANTHEPWQAKHRRKKNQQAAVRRLWLASPLSVCAGANGWPFPLRVQFLHVGPRMDDDNLQTAFKAIRDEIAELIGVDDGDPRVAWEYAQAAGKSAVGIRIRALEGA